MIIVILMLVALIATCAIKLFNELYVGDIEKMSVADIIEMEEYLEAQTSYYSEDEYCHRCLDRLACDYEERWYIYEKERLETELAIYKHTLRSIGREKFGVTATVELDSEIVEKERLETELAIYKHMLRSIEFEKFGVTATVELDSEIVEYDIACDNHKVGHKAKLLNREVHDLYDIYRFGDPGYRTGGHCNRRGNKIRKARHNDRRAKLAFKESCYSQYDSCNDNPKGTDK